jgi:hypothetical protein
MKARLYASYYGISGFPLLGMIDAVAIFDPARNGIFPALFCSDPVTTSLPVFNARSTASMLRKISSGS